MPQLFAIILSLFMTHAYAEKIIAAGDPWPPFLDPESATGGIAMEIAQAAFSTQGHELEMKWVPWARAINGVKEADYDILIGTWWTEERTSFLAFSEPYIENLIKLIKRKGDSFEYHEPSSLDGLNIGIVRGYGYSDDFLNATNYRRPEAKDLLTNIKKLISNRIDLTLEDEIVARALLKSQAPELLTQIEFVAKPLSTNTLHVSSGLQNSRHKFIIQAFNQGLAEIKSNGTFDRIMKEYGY